MQDQLRRVVEEQLLASLEAKASDEAPRELITCCGSCYGLVVTEVDVLNRGVVVLATPFSAYTTKVVASAFRLTPMQLRVAGLIACRRTNAEIAEALHISPNTARRHTEAVMLKLRVKSRLEVEPVLRSVLIPNPTDGRWR